jgi:hypothetical protein
MTGIFVASFMIKRKRYNTEREENNADTVCQYPYGIASPLSIPPPPNPVMTRITKIFHPLLILNYLNENGYQLNPINPKKLDCFTG